MTHEKQKNGFNLGVDCRAAWCSWWKSEDGKENQGGQKERKKGHRGECGGANEATAQLSHHRGSAQPILCENSPEPMA
jgi:hypothetical protein